METVSINIEQREKRIILSVKENFKNRQNKICTMSLTIEELLDFECVGRALRRFGERIVSESVAFDKRSVEDKFRRKMMKN